MIRSMPKADRRKARFYARRQWRTWFLPIAIVDVQGSGRSLVLMRRLETRWSDAHHRRLWRVPERDQPAATALTTKTENEA